MKQGLSLRVSQHLALTPQLRQSIRLLQLSTLELGQEIQQMLDDNPFLDVQSEDLGEEFGLAASDQKAAGDDAEPAFEPAPTSVAERAAPAEAATSESEGGNEAGGDDG